MKLATHEAGNLAWLRESGLILWCLTAYPSLSKLVIADVAQLLDCLSEPLPVILLCRPGGSSEDSTEQIISQKSLCCSFLSHWRFCEKQAFGADLYSLSFGWKACCVTMTASCGQTPWGCESLSSWKRILSN